MAKEKKGKQGETQNPWLKREEEVLAFWQKAGIFRQSVEKDAPQGGYVFYEGPPTANGTPGIHHVLARAFKDVLPRYKTMRGFRVERKAGWDTHGLPVEIQVEKELGISGKPEIEKYGIAEFNQKCKESVWRYKDEWEKLTDRIAFWVDMEKPYVTYENAYIESVWHIVKEAHEKGLLYKGHKVVHHCPRCGTALSSHEVAQGYRVVKDNSVYVKFKIKNEKVKSEKLKVDGDLSILAWTTTPWTLPGNVALAVGKEIDYVIAKCVMMNEESGINEYFILAKDRLPVIEFEYDIVAEIKGEELAGVEYEPLFDIKSVRESGKKAHFVATADFVSTADGTGVVHTAVMYGEDDYVLGETIGLPKVHTVDEEGKFVGDLAAYGLAGKFVKAPETEKTILDHLRRSGNLFKEELYEHDYPFCWRCDSPLLYYAKNSWFIKMTAVRDQLIANNETINWVPKHIKTGRFGEWLVNVKDWAISRERYWGTPLPVWECKKCSRLKVVGSAAELETELPDLHRPYIDEIKFKCECGGEMTRDKSVLDCWFDSGAMPFAQQHYPFENKELIDEGKPVSATASAGKQYPADYICEAIDQTRGWFYTLLAISTFLGRGACYKNVICLGHINDKFGKKMSKSKGNIIDPWTVIGHYGVDAARLHMYTINSPGDPKNYDLNDVRDVFRKNIMILWNVYSFYEMYVKNAKIKNQNEKFLNENILDKWILARLAQLTEKITGDLDRYHVYEAAREIPIFINDLSTWYLRRSRERFKSEDEKDKEAALATLGFVLQKLSKVMAPFMPFMAEQLWQKVTGNDFKNPDKSVHLEEWPSDLRFENEDLRIIEEMEMVRKIVELGLAERDKAGIKVRQPLTELKVKSGKLKVDGEFVELVKDEVNVKKVVFEAGEELAVELNTTLTEELRREGMKREIVRAVNNLRKEAGLTINDRIVITWSGGGEIGKVMADYGKEILKETLADDFEHNGRDGKEVNINGEKAVLAIRKLG